jgi:geranylgeranyl diphosphate synthase type I
MKEVLAPFRSALDERISLFWENKLEAYELITANPLLLRFVKQAQGVSQGGKRVRPFMAWLASGKPLSDLTETEWGYFLAIELIHIFALIHDDIMDQADTRHHTPTIHRFAAEQLTKDGRSGDVEFQGNMQAMLVGDLVFWLAGDFIIPDLDNFNARRFKSIRAEFTHLVEKVVFGQMLDFDTMSRFSISDNEVVEKTLHKTAHYTFSYPLTIGNQLSDTPEQPTLLLQIGTSLGLAYQIQDDLLDVTGKTADKPRFQDVPQGQHTVLSQHIFTSGTKHEQEILRSFWRQPLSQAQQMALYELFLNSGALDHARHMANDYFNQTETLIDTLTSKTLRTNLHAVVTYLKNRDH